MKKLLPAVIAVSTLGLAGAAYAAEYVNVYTCEMKEGAEMDDVQAANSKWLKWVQDNVDESIKSSVGTSVVGNQEIFIFVDTYPSLTVWAATRPTRSRICSKTRTTAVKTVFGRWRKPNKGNWLGPRQSRRGSIQATGRICYG